MCLLGEESAKSVNSAFKVPTLIPLHDKKITELRRLWEMAKGSLPDEAVSYDIPNDLGNGFMEKGKREEMKVFYLTALEGRRRVLGAEHKKTLGSLYNLWLVLQNMEVTKAR